MGGAEQQCIKRLTLKHRTEEIFALSILKRHYAGYLGAHHLGLISLPEILLTEEVVKLMQLIPLALNGSVANSGTVDHLVPGGCMILSGIKHEVIVVEAHGIRRGVTHSGITVLQLRLLKVLTVLCHQRLLLLGGHGNKRLMLGHNAAVVPLSKGAVKTYLHTEQSRIAVKCLTKLLDKIKEAFVKKIVIPVRILLIPPIGVHLSRVLEDLREDRIKLMISLSGNRTEYGGPARVGDILQTFIYKLLLQNTLVAALAVLLKTVEIMKIGAAVNDRVVTGVKIASKKTYTLHRLGVIDTVIFKFVRFE